MDYLILSNNDSLENELGDIPVQHVSGALDDFYSTLENLLQNGYQLLTSPLPPNVPLIRAPIRSVILRASEHKYDARGILALERARERSQTLGVKALPGTMRDLQYIDRDHLLRALEQLAELAESKEIGQQKLGHDN